ncbi:uncharacterized protein, partial [Palaemon carinicauda]|uniref:uncharacterized protein n=1 Tax=Palaemon carinicauda TaxID=392227 RepID=UPI0035B5C42E
PCQIITELQTAFGRDDSLTFFNISNVNYIREDKSYTFDFFNLIIKNFPEVFCKSINVFEQEEVAILILAGNNLEFITTQAIIGINQHDFAYRQITDFSSLLRFYTLELWFVIDSYSQSNPFKLCITRDSLQMTFNARRIENTVGVSLPVAQELNDHPKAVVEAINLHLPRFAGDLTTRLNSILCKPNPITTAATPNPTPARTT